MGPAFWAWENLFGRSQAIWDLLWIFYRPIALACDGEPAYSAIAWWINLWTGT
jgi:hypothetical protein